ncbi:MAG: tRNA-intron lyase [Desulfurococcaceae archaeon]
MLYNRVIVPNYDCANSIYWNGYYGSFLGVSKPRSRDIKAPLELSIIEAVYLLEKGVLKVEYNGRLINYNELYSKGFETIEEFSDLYRVYKDLRERGFIVRRGLKFGCDYLIYRFGPGIDHAPFGVEVMNYNSIHDPIVLVRMGRLLHSVRKKLILAIVINDRIEYILLTWWKP